ncbi:MAG: hypothetical protein LBT57_02790 [Puniceicoccales bacterium]|nr:hypothetical protein [Puniceicoccales bacterium]
MKSIPILFSNIAGETHRSHITYRAGEAITRHRLVKLSPDGTAVSVAGIGDRPIGLSTDEAAPGEMLDIALLGSSDTLTAQASGSIQAGDILVPATEGHVQALPATTGSYRQIGIALRPAVADALVEIMPCVPCPYTVDGN